MISVTLISIDKSQTFPSATDSNSDTLEEIVQLIHFFFILDLDLTAVGHHGLANQFLDTPLKTLEHGQGLQTMISARFGDHMTQRSTYKSKHERKAEYHEIPSQEQKV